MPSVIVHSLDMVGLCKTLKLHILSALILVQTVCKGFQQTIKVPNSRQKFKLYFFQKAHKLHNFEHGFGHLQWLQTALRLCIYARVLFIAKASGHSLSVHA